LALPFELRILADGGEEVLVLKIPRGSGVWMELEE